ncbi:MAG: bifunctional metallophosphatase/5'-nucleotidase, partial [Ruthenibacterium sp.]
MSVTAFGASAAPPDALTILFTHDTHDHFLPAAKESGGEYGGYTRLATLIKDQRAKAENPIITVDAGDFSMGTLFQTIYTTHAPELRALSAMGYDAATLGNHEFDYRAQGLIGMLSAAK